MERGTQPVCGYARYNEVLTGPFMSFLDRLDSIAKRMERFVAGAAPSDPLYITNRTFGQKLRMGLLIGTPVLAVAGLVALALGSFFDSPSANKAASLSATGDVTAKVLPHLEKDYKSESDRQVEVTEAVVSRGANAAITGMIRNNTDRTVGSADVVFDVTDDEGSALGAVAVRVENIAARATVPFHKPIEQRTARLALVRELHVR
jgi:hypothetical protein